MRKGAISFIIFYNKKYNNISIIYYYETNESPDAVFTENVI